MKRLLERALYLCARAILKKYRPMVIGVTGSVGKTSAKQAIFAVVSGRYRVRATAKNYNNEIGVPLTVIGVDSPGRSVVGWMYVFCRVFSLLLWRHRDYPDVLVLEMGADRPGDILYLTTLAPAHIGVVTAVGEAHHEFFRDIDAIAREKQTMITHLGVDDIAVLNVDDPRVRDMGDLTRARVVTYGQTDDARVRLVEMEISYVQNGDRVRPAGIRCKLHYEGATVPVFLPGVLGRGQVMAALSAVAVGVALGMHLVEVSERLALIEFPCGRMRIIDGIRRTTIIDDTYNASPLAMIFALDALRDVRVCAGARRIAVLGDMLELGSISEDAHRDIGLRVQAFNVDVLVVVGVAAQRIADEAIASGFDEQCVARFHSADDAGMFVQEIMREGDVVLVKGSQGVRLEKVVLEIMAQPADAVALLCRQSAEWL